MLTTEARHLPNRDSHSAFEVFVAVANATIDVERDVRARNLALRTVLSNTLQDDEFVVDIAERALIRLVNDGDNWTNSPLHVDPARGFAVNLIYWPAGVSCAPHQHQHWTLTGVVYGDIVTTTYLRDPAMRIDRRFEGRPGDVGYIEPPCIHNVGNPYRCPALTIHLFGGDPVNESGATARLNDATVCFEDDDTTAFIPNPQRTAAATLADVLASTQSKRGTHLLRRYSEPAISSLVRSEMLKGLLRRKPSEALSALRQIVVEAPAADLAFYTGLIEKLERAL